MDPVSNRCLGPALVLLCSTASCAPNYYSRSDTTYNKAVEDLGAPLEVCLVTTESVTAFGNAAMEQWIALEPLVPGDFYARWVEPGGGTELSADGERSLNVFYYPILVFDQSSRFKGAFRYEHATPNWFAQPPLTCPTSRGIPQSEMQYLLSAEAAFREQRFDDVIRLLPEAKRMHSLGRADKSFKYWLEAYPYLAIAYWKVGQDDSSRVVLEELLDDAEKNATFWDADRRTALARRMAQFTDLVPTDHQAYFLEVINQLTYMQP